MNKEELLELLKGGERQKVEFKKSFDSKALIAINAMANSSGGYVIIGVADDGRVTGVSLEKESIQKWMNEIKQKTEPSITPNVLQITYDGKNVVIFQVVEVPFKPISLQGRYFSRKGNSNHQLSLDEIFELRLESLNQSFDSFLVKASYVDLNKHALLLFEEKTKENGRFLPSALLANDFIKLGFIQGGKLTRGAELLFGTHHTSIHIGRFKSADTIIDDILIKQPLVLAVEEAMQFIKKNIRLGYEFEGELSRKDKWQFPLQVIRELLLNAIIHKDYRNPTDVIIKIFDDSLSFSNPGGLYGNLTIADLETDKYQPRHRNRLLAEAFYLMGEVEKYGTGFIRIRKWLKDYPELEYELENMGDFTRVFLRQKSIKSDSLGDKLGNKLGDKLGDNQLLILDAINKNSKISLSQLSGLIGISQTAIENNINKLKSIGLLKRIGSTKGGHWEITE